MRSTKQSVIESYSINNPTVPDILTSQWEEYSRTHIVRPVVQGEVEKTLLCRTGEKGVYIYRCLDCNKSVYQLLGCNSRLCSRCGKRYNDQWAKSLSKAMFQVPHRHFVMSIPPHLWPYLKEDRSLWKPYMDSAIETCNDYFPKIMRNPHIKPGAIVVLHPFGRDMQFKPHLHIIVTEGGFTGKGDFIKREFFPARKFAKCWQYHVSRKLQEAGVPKPLFTKLYQKYGGFFVWVHRGGKITHPKKIIKYLGRYLRHPAIANSRITSFDGRTVKFYYEREDETGLKTRHEVTMPVNEFITALIQHVPEKQFKMVRYYGAYARRKKKVFAAYASQSSIGSTVQDTIYMPGRKFKPQCPSCGGMLEFVAYETIPPPEDHFHWDVPKEKLVVWRTRN